MQTDEYVILDKITRFRQDNQMSSISKIVLLFVKVWENNEDHTLLSLSLCCIVPTSEVVSQRHWWRGVVDRSAVQPA